MELSCSTCCIPEYKLDKDLELFSSAGYKYFETFTTWTGGILDVHKVDKKEVKNKLEKYNIKLSSLNIENFVAEDETSFNARLERQKHNIHWAIELGCGKINFKGGKRTEADMQNLIKGTKELAEYCEDLPVELCLANHHGNRIENIEDLDIILSWIDHPKVGILVDIGHYFSSQVDIPALIKKHGSRIKLVHTKDQIGKQSVPFGEGEIDNQGLLKMVHDIGYDDFIVVEIEVKDKENTPQYI
ncbi:TIM barrel protein, partial [Candidatus Poribacteria bacterium]|nr:TIM barrel protein [Candidatus Poribacteria bacterium]